ncbi:MAG: hypothetical protein H7X91_11770 [Burkholderiales bacterium]|nr:hypothetical protein [Burkholderiales bacterium]
MNAPLPVPQADAALIWQALDALFEPDDVIELRALHTRGRKRTDAGYFDGDHRDALVREAARLNKAGAAVYVTMNRIDPHLLARCANRVQENVTATATDANVTLRRWLLLDFDPARPKDTSATDVQLAAAKDKARECYSFLKAKGWPEPLIAESGNGMHLLYPIDLPNDETNRDLIKSVLVTLAERFDNDATKLDTSVFNAGRIVKLYGTVANKGDHIPALAPWRLSRLVRAPQRTVSITVAQLRALSQAGPVAHQKAAAARFRFELRPC